MIDWADQASTGLAGIDDAGMGSWLSKLIKNNKNTIAKIAPIASIVSAAIPVVGPAVSIATGVVANAAGNAIAEDAAKKQAEANAAAAAALTTTTTTPAPTTAAASPAQPTWLMPALIAAGVVMLARRR